MAKNYFDRYIWLVETLRTHSRLTLSQIKRAWLNSSVNDDHKDLADRTFFNNIESIRDMLGVSIVCDRSTNEYYIDNSDDVCGSGVRNWMLNALSLSNFLAETVSMRNRILFEEIPSSQKFLLPIISAMKEERAINVLYKSFARNDAENRELNPYCLKSYGQRWYLLASTDDNPEPHIYSLDRIVDIQQSERSFVLPDDFDAEAYFSSYCGYPLRGDESAKLSKVRVKVSAHQRNYLRELPIHHSQQETEVYDEYSVFEYHLIPNYHFKSTLMSYMYSVEVLEPSELREEMKKIVNQIYRLYNLN